MEKLNAIVLGLLVSFTAWAGNDVGGGGMAENNFIYSFMNLKALVSVCLESSSCKLDARDKALLEKIHDSMAQEKEAKDAVVFRAESQSPGFFDVDGPHRIAKTAYEVGSPIYINRDLLYGAVPASIPVIPPIDRPFDIPNAVAILIHELGHHQGERDHAYLDQLGSKVQTLMRATAQEQDGGPYQRSLIATTFTMAGANTVDLILRNGDMLYSFGDALTEFIRCPSGDKPKAFALWNLHWMRRDIRRGTVRLPLRARVVSDCPRQAQGIGSAESELEIGFFFKETPAQGDLLQKEKTELRQIDCRITPQLCY